MTTYRTGNAIGSVDPRDLYDNAENLDELVNSQDKAEHPDRLGVPRKTWHGMEQEFQAAQADKQQRFNALLAASGYVFVGDYAAGITVSEYNEVIRDTAGNLWRAGSTTDLPYTTDGTGMPEGGAFVAAGDAVLRNDLMGEPVNGQGALLVRGSVIYVDTIADLQALPTSELVDGQQVQVKEYHAGTGTGGGLFYYDPTNTSEPDGILVFAAGPGGVFIRQNVDRPSVLSAGAKRDGDNDDSPAFQIFAGQMDLARFASMYIPNTEGTYRISSTVVMKEPGVLIYGDRGPTYERGLGRPGNILIGESTDVGLDLGAYRTSASTTNPSDEWTVEGVGFLPERTDRTQHAIALTSQRNGPDRGARFSKISGRNLRSVIYIPPLQGSATTSTATLCVEDSNLSNNLHGILSEGKVLGLRFVNNQAEQMYGECIKGSFSNAVTIENNMLEGTGGRDNDNGTIDIIPAANGNRLTVSLKNNYFEANRGPYIARFRTTALGQLDSGGNTFSDSSASNFIVLEGSWEHVRNADELPITLGVGDDPTYIRDLDQCGSSKYFSFKVAGRSSGAPFLARQTSGIHSFIGSGDPADYVTYDAGGTVGTTAMLTPFGVTSCYTGPFTSWRSMGNVTAKAGDWLIYTALLKSTTEYTTLPSMRFRANGVETSPQSVGLSSGRWNVVVGSVEVLEDINDELLECRFLNADDIGLSLATISAKVEPVSTNPVSLTNPLEIRPYIADWSDSPA